MSLSEHIYAQAVAAGFDDCGIIALREMEGYGERVAERMARVPESGRFYERFLKISDVQARFPWAKSIVICTTWLGKYRYPPQLQGRYAKSYFLSPESDRTSAPYLQKQRFTQWLDVQGIRWDGGLRLGHAQIGGLRYAAMAAGLGIVRKNNFLYNEKGSYLELDGYVIDRACSLHQHRELRPCPERCSLCRKNCPTQTLSAPYTMNPLHCVSFCTTFGKGRVPEGLSEADFGEWIVGCDACQDCCPFNRHDWSEGEDFPGLRELLPLLEPERVVEAPEALLREKLAPKTVDHIMGDEIETFRVNARRVVRNHCKIDCPNQRNQYGGE